MKLIKAVPYVTLDATYHDYVLKGETYMIEVLPKVHRLCKWF